MAEPATPMRAPFEARLPCPVCLGVQMAKVQIGNDTSLLVLDHCPRCGGVWFEKGEVQQLARHTPAELWKHIPPRESAPRPPCHGCTAPLDRDAERCAVCGTKNELSCPSCEKRMERRQQSGLTLDVCAHCKGVWFDNAELRSLWTITIDAANRRYPGRGAQAAAVGGDILLESLFWAPGLVVETGVAAVHGIGHVAGALGGLSLDGAASAALGAADVVGGAAEGLFEMIMSIIGSIFDGS